MTVAVLVPTVAACGSSAPPVSSASVAHRTTASGGHTSRASGDASFSLVTLPQLGSLSWRCVDAHAGRRYALSFAADAQGATETVSYTDLGRVSTSVVQPGESLAFGFGGSEARMVEIAQPTEPGTIRAAIRVWFGSVHYCAAYEPPGLDVHESWVANAAR